MKRFFLLIGVFFLLCSKESPTGPSISRYRYLMENVKPQVESFRGLSFLREVHLALMSRSQYAASRYSRSSGSAQLYSTELKQLGFIPDTMKNFGQTVESYDDNFAAAFYVPGTDSLYIINPEKYEDYEFEFYVAHELTHALQDQHFNPFTPYIYPALSQSASNSDFYLSQLCVTEGDASFSGYLYFINTYTDVKEADLVDTFSVECENFYKEFNTLEIPRYLDISRMAPYTLGQYFIAKKKQSQGWNAINDLYNAKRISSTVEIITGTPGALVTFDYSKISPILLNGTRKLLFADDDTYGPVMLMALISDYTDPDHCKKAFGWQGDRILYVLKDNDKYGSLVWAIGFQTVADADYMWNALDKLLSGRRFDNTAAGRVDSLNAITFTHPGISTTLFKLGTTVLWVENVANPAQIAELIQPAALAKSAIGQKDYSTLAKEEKWRLLREELNGSIPGWSNVR